VRGAHRPPTWGQGGALNPIDAKPVQPDGRTYDIHDRIDRPDLVKMHLLQIRTVRFRLRLAKLLKNRLRKPRVHVSKPSLVDDRLDVMQVPMRVLMWRRHSRMRRPKTRALHRLEPQLGTDSKPADDILKHSGVNARVHQRAKRHVARNPRETLEIRDTHQKFPIAKKGAKLPAALILSTATPLARSTALAALSGHAVLAQSASQIVETLKMDGA
jgi:hypothetical protein